MANFVFPEEVSYFVKSIRSFRISEVGNAKWHDAHEMIIKLSQQAVLEASEHREEDVKEHLILHDKLKVLIREAFCIMLWKTRVLPHLIEVDPNPPATFLIYTVLYHEAAAITLLDVVLFHASACEVLKDSALDLIDYGAQGVAQVIGLVSMGYHENETKTDVDEAVLSELERHKRDFIYKIGMRCISILSYMAENIDSLPLSAGRRMIITHDIPWLVCDLLHFRPWQRKTSKGVEKFLDDKWTLVGDDIHKLSKQEAQAWLCLHQILFNASLMQSYEINPERRNHLTVVNGLLNDAVMDQLPPLIELKQMLCQLGVGGGSDIFKKTKVNLLLEEVANFKETLIKEVEEDGGFYEIAQKQESIFLSRDQETIFKMAQRLNTAYNTDLLAELEQKVSEAETAERQSEQKTAEPQDKTNASNNDQSQNIQGHQVESLVGKRCAHCSKTASKRCGQCNNVFYCSRKCQLEHWPTHKLNC